MTGAGAGAETLWLQPGQVIIREGDQSRELFALLSGELVVTIGGKQAARICGQGEVLGELGALTGQPRTATVSARVASEVLLVRHATPQLLERLPSVLEKIDMALTRRFHIIFNKTLMYKSITATIRRSVLQEAMRESLETRRKITPGEEVDGGLLRHQVRQRIDERLAMYTDLDDPKVLERIASEYGVQDVYRDKVVAKPWLDESMVLRLNTIENSWRLLEEQKGAKVVMRRAEVVIEAHRLLQEYETMPGIRREMDIMRMEGIVPFRAKVEALKTTFMAHHLQDIEDERSRLHLDRRIKIAVDGAKADAGNDVVMLFHAARELGIENEYEAQIRNLVAMSETGTHFVDMSSAVLPDDAKPALG